MYLEDKTKHPLVALDPRREARGYLIDLLRDPDRWPPGFVWCYGMCHSCAMGLLVAMGKLSATQIDVRGGEHNMINKLFRDEATALADGLGLSPSEARRIFLGANYYVSNSLALICVLPEHIAAMLEDAPYESL